VEARILDTSAATVGSIQLADGLDEREEENKGIKDTLCFFDLNNLVDS
jgi:hypothetical protein